MHAILLVSYISIFFVTEGPGGKISGWTKSTSGLLGTWPIYIFRSPIAFLRVLVVLLRLFQVCQWEVHFRSIDAGQGGKKLWSKYPADVHC